MGKSIVKGTSAYGKEEQTRKSEVKLSQKLRADLESALLRLFQKSSYCDVELIAESDSILTHSCILQARVARFYKFLVTECQVLQKNGFSSIIIYNVSFISLRSFVEKIYKDVEVWEVETCMLETLLARNSEHTVHNNSIQASDPSEKSSAIVLSPEADLFYTPKCSPSEIQKPFGQSFSNSPIKRKDNDITCYYKIVSVDDVQIDEKVDEKSKNATCNSGGEHLEKELAEQEELFLSFKSILSKVNKGKASTLPNTPPNTVSSFSKKVDNSKPKKRLQSNLVLADKKSKAKLPAWRSNQIAQDTEGNLFHNRNPTKRHLGYNPSDYPRKKLELHPTLSSQEARNLCSFSEMDMSTTGIDSGVETSSSCQQETKDRTVSETSGIDITDTTINDEIPHDEETVSTKPAGSILSLSSDEGTWDVNNENRMGFRERNDKSGDTDSEVCVFEESNQSFLLKEDEENGLKEEEVARLDEMEKNIRECETFLDRERQIFYCFDNNLMIQPETKDKTLKRGQTTDQTISVLQSVKDVILQNQLILSTSNRGEMNEENGEIPFSEDIYDKESENFTKSVSDHVESLNCESDLNSGTLCSSLTVNEHGNDDYVFSEQTDFKCLKSSESCMDNKPKSLTGKDHDANVFNVQQHDILEIKTPPCSPKQICKLPFTADSETKSHLAAPQVKTGYDSLNNTIPVVNNFFIDASSLLDEDEIISPPISLSNFKNTEVETDTKREEEKYKDESNGGDKENFETEDQDVFHLQKEERRQGDLIFKNSIPHFSRHEVEKTDMILENQGEYNYCSSDADIDDNEQVVPSGDVQLTNDSDREVIRETHVNEDFRTFSVSPVQTSDFEILGDRVLEENESTEPKADITDNIVKRKDAESLPIVSGGLLPEDFSNTSPNISSPHLCRRNESVPIISGGMEYIEEEKKIDRKSSLTQQSAAWVVSFDDKKPHRRRHIRTVTTSESDMESLELNYELLDSKRLREISSELKEANSSNSECLNSYSVNNAKETEKEGYYSQRTLNPIEKSASLGYFIEFSKEPCSSRLEEEEENNRVQENGKKNIFSIFIDMKKDDQEISKSDPTLERQNTCDKSSDIQEETVRKPFYMFIESDNSVSMKRKTHPLVIPRKLTKSFEENQDSSQSKNFEFRKKTTGNMGSNEDVSLTSSKNFKEDTQCSPEVGQENNAENEQKMIRQLKHSKLPLPLCKSSSLSAVNGDPKMVVWSSKKDQKNEAIVPGETWVRTNDIQVTYKGKREENETDDNFLKNASPLSIPHEPSETNPRKESRRHSDNRGGFHLRTVDERSPFKSPEERDSGVIVTEESDDSFVKLSDMDNYKNPYLEDNKKKISVNTMSLSIPESGWIENKAFVKGKENEMSRSIGTSIVKSNSGTTFASDKNVSRSLSRLFPNLNFSNSFGRKTNTNISPGGKQDTDPSDTQASEVSEMSSIQSSFEPSALETSTSETDISCHNGTSRLGEDLLRMFLEEISPDVVVEVGGRRMKAHKCILSSRCQYFAAMLSGGWVESAGNVISLQGFSYNSVHFALCHIYSGENRIPDSLNIIELATLADMLCLEGLKEVISHTLKVKYCHCFHQPCDECHVGVIDCLPVAAAYGLDDLYRKCLRWITKHFVRVWPSKTFASLPKELLDKCYQHHVVHMTVENVLDTILNIDTVRGSLPNVRWSETISRLVTKLHDAAVKYIADHFSSILTSDNFLALGKEAGWSVGRLEDSLMKATKSLPPEQACWSHARLHRILTVTKGPNPPSEMDWNENFIDLLQCISEHVENSLIKQAPRAAKSKAWRQMEPELRSRIQERACLVLPEEPQNLRQKRTGPLKRESRQNNTSLAARSNSRNVEIRHMKLAMTQQVHRTASLGRVQNADQRAPSKEIRSLKTAPGTASVKKTETNIKKPGTGIPENKKITPSRFMDVKPRYLEPRSPQKTVSDKTSNTSNIRRTRPLSSSDSSRNCSPLNATTHYRMGVGPNTRRHRDSVLSTGSAASFDGKRDRSYVSVKSETSIKTLNRLTTDNNMSTDSLFTDSLYSEKDATTQKSDDPTAKGKENMRKPATKTTNVGLLPKSSNNSPNSKRLNSENSTPASFKSNTNRKLISSASETKVIAPKRFATVRLTNINQRTNPAKTSLASPRNSTNRTMLQNSKYDANVINGNMVKKKKEVDADNNKNNVKDDKIPSTVSRSGTFLKDEPTILKKPENIESGF